MIDHFVLYTGWSCISESISSSDYYYLGLSFILFSIIIFHHYYLTRNIYASPCTHIHMSPSHNRARTHDPISLSRGLFLRTKFFVFLFFYSWEVPFFWYSWMILITLPIYGDGLFHCLIPNPRQKYKHAKKKGNHTNAISPSSCLSLVSGGLV